MPPERRLHFRHLTLLNQFQKEVEQEPKVFTKIIKAARQVLVLIDTNTADALISSYFPSRCSNSRLVIDVQMLVHPMWN